MPPSIIPSGLDAVRQAQTIQLDIPISIAAGKSWGPHQWAGSTQLSRVEQVAYNKLPKAPKHEGGKPLRIELVERIGWRRFADLFYAQIHVPAGRPSSSSSPCASPPARVVLKIVDFSLFSPTSPPKRAFAEQCFAQDWAAFTQLAPIQGTVVPHLAGVYAHENNNVYCAVYEDAGRLLTLEERYMERSIGEQFLSAVEKINDAGVAFIPFQWQCVCIDNSGQIKITDFIETWTIARLADEHEKETAKGDDESDDGRPHRTLEEEVACSREHAIEMAKDLLRWE